MEGKGAESLASPIPGGTGNKILQHLRSTVFVLLLIIGSWMQCTVLSRSSLPKWSTIHMAVYLSRSLGLGITITANWRESKHLRRQWDSVEEGAGKKTGWAYEAFGVGLVSMPGSRWNELSRLCLLNYGNSIQPQRVHAFWPLTFLQVLAYWHRDGESKWKFSLCHIN